MVFTGGEVCPVVVDLISLALRSGANAKDAKSLYSSFRLSPLICPYQVSSLSDLIAEISSYDESAYHPRT